MVTHIARDDTMQPGDNDSGEGSVMRRLMMWAAVLSLLALGGGVARANAPASPAACVPAPTGRVPQQIGGIWRWAGNGSEVSDPFDLPAGNYRVSFDTKSTTTTDLSLAGLDRTGYAAISLTSGQHGEDLASSSEPIRVILSIRDDAPWTVTIQPLH